MTLGIETSCDETSVSLADKGMVLSNIVSSSVHLHSAYGGVIPEIASRYHSEYIFSIFSQALKRASKNAEDIELVAVTKGPGLPGSLLVGMAFAKAISYSLDVPIVGVDHVHAHLVSGFIGGLDPTPVRMRFPFLGLAVSGGHTSIYYCKSIDDFELIGRTKDDAAGEAFDKVAKVLELGYPGGPVIEKKAAEWAGSAGIEFPRALLDKTRALDFSFSGVKTAVLYYWQKSGKKEEDVTRICSAFQESVADTVVRKVKRALKTTKAKMLAAGGGVLNNGLLRERLSLLAEASGVEIFLAEKEYCADNAAMVAILGELLYNIGCKDDLFLKIAP